MFVFHLTGSLVANIYDVEWQDRLLITNLQGRERKWSWPN